MLKQWVEVWGIIVSSHSLEYLPRKYFQSLQLETPRLTPRDQGQHHQWGKKSTPHTPHVMHGEGPCITPGFPAAVKDTGGSTVRPCKGCGSDNHTASVSISWFWLLHAYGKEQLCFWDVHRNTQRSRVPSCWHLTLTWLIKMNMNGGNVGDEHTRVLCSVFTPLLGV